MNLKNSMILANMLSQKPKIMYATIKGTLTENDGVFSGFSSSNYLVLQDDITEIPTNFEIQIRISIPATNSGYAIHFLSYSGNSSGIRVFASGKLSFYSRNNDGNVVEIIGTTVLSLDTFYFIKIKKVGNTITLYSSLDKNIWITEGTTTTTSTIPLNSKIGFGHCGDANNNNYIFNGTLDLNRSYIKINDTKYNLQAVVGYTIVGSPTITDGVVSGFSSGNYLETAGFAKYATDISFDFKVVFQTSNVSVNRQILSSFALACQISYGKIEFVVRNKNSSWVYCYGGPNLTNNTKYYVRFQYNLNKIILFISTDDINYTLINSVDIEFITVKDNKIKFGFENQTIYIDECYIKFNNKLWFNGQPA